MTYDLVFHVDSKDESMMRLALSQAADYRAAVQQMRCDEMNDVLALGTSTGSMLPVPFRIAFVINGPAVRYMTTGNAELQEEAREAYDHGVQFYVGRNALARESVRKEDVWPFVEHVPSGILKIVEFEH